MTFHILAHTVPQENDKEKEICKGIKREEEGRKKRNNEKIYGREEIERRNEREKVRER